MVNDLTEEILTRRDSVNVRREATDRTDGTSGENPEQGSAGKQLPSVETARQHIADIVNERFYP